MHEIGRLEVAAGSARAVLSDREKRSGLLDAVDAPALTPKVPALRLKIAPQIGTAPLREREGQRVGSGRDGRGSFRAFAV